MSDQKKIYSESNIDFFKLWRVVVEGKWIILGITGILTLASVIYTQIATPIYEGRVAVEIGELVLNRVANATTATGIQVIPIDNPNDLAKVVEERFQERFQVNLSKGTQKVIEIKFQDEDKTVIQEELKLAVDFILERHSEKIKLYQDVCVSETKQVSEVLIFDNPVKPKTKIIIGFSLFFGLIFSFLIVLIREALKKSRIATNS